MDLPNRRQRREMAKAAGYFKMKERATTEQRYEMLKRSVQLGHQIHLSNVERNLRENEERIQRKEQEKINLLIEGGHSPEEAMRIFRGENNTEGS